MKKKEVLSIVIKFLIIISSVYGMMRLCVGEGWLCLSYFTILSNIFVCVMTLLFLIKNAYFVVKKKKLKFNDNMYVAKFLAIVSIALTFCVYLILLAPTTEGGMINAYLEKGAGSLCVHFIAPLLAIIDFICFDNEYKYNKIHSVYTIIPPFVYAILVVFLSKVGIRWGNMAVPYNFLNFYSKTGWFGFNPTLFSNETTGIGVFYSIVVFSIIYILIGFLFVSLRTKINKKKTCSN